VKVHLHEPIEVGFAHLVEIAPECDTGIVDDQVHLAVSAQHLARKIGDCRSIGDIQAMLGASNTQSGGVTSGLCELGFPDVAQAEATTPSGQRERDGTANAPARAGDDRNAILELHGNACELSDCCLLRRAASAR
jgi:hypothetical protein